MHEKEDGSDERFKDKSKSAIESLTEQERVCLVKKVLETLHEEERTLTDLLFYQQFSHKSVARIMGKSVDALYMQKRRILEKLKEFLEKNVGIEEVRRLL